MSRFRAHKARIIAIIAAITCVVGTGAPVAIADAGIGAVGSWATGTNLPLDVSGAVSVTYNGYAYVLSGASSSTGDKSSAVYYAKLGTDGTVGSWTTSTHSLPQALYYPSAVTANGYIYVMGGYSTGFQSAVYYAKINSDGSIGSWTTSANSLPQGMYQAAAATNNGYLYFIGGINGSFTALNTTYYAKLNNDGSTGTWAASTNVLPQGVEDAAAATENGAVYILGGSDGSSSVDSVYTAMFNADGSIGSWTTSANSLPQALDGATAVMTNGYIYVAGGNDTGGNSQHTVYYSKLTSNGTTGPWTTSTSTLPQTLQFSTAITYGGYFYVIAGQNNGNTQDTIYYSKLNFVNQQSGVMPDGQALVATTPAGTNIASLTTSASTSSDAGYSYPLGLASFTFTTSTIQNQVSLTFQTSLTPGQVVARKYNPTSRTYSTIPGAVVAQTTLNGQPALNVTYTIADGGALDEDGSINGTVVDPVGLAQTTAATIPQAPNTGFGTPQPSNTLTIDLATGSIITLSIGAALLRRQYKHSARGHAVFGKNMSGSDAK